MARKDLFLLSLIVGALLINPPPGWAQSEEAREDRLAEGLAEDRGAAISSAEELIEMLKQRALRKMEEKQREQLRATKGTVGLHIGYDKNANTNSDRRGDLYFEQYFSFAWVPTFNDYFGAEIGPWHYADIYFDNQDTTILDAAFKVILKYFPTGKPYFELQPGWERQYVHYPDAGTSSYTEDKLFLKFKHRFWKRWSHDGKYEYSFKEYDKKRPRTNTSTDFISGMVVEKNRHAFEYNLGFPLLGKNNAKIKQKFYTETSNDNYREYYDLYSYKVTGELGRSLTKKLYAKASSAYERKNYCKRRVGSPASYAEMEYDDVYTQKLYFYYTLKKDWTLSYTFTHKKSDSNYAVYDYDQVSHLAGLYVSF